MSQIRQNYHQDTENAVNQQISLALHASYTYLGMAFHFDRDDVALPHLHKFFAKRSEDKQDMAEKLMKYQNMRGGRVLMQPVQKPTQDVWGSATDALQSALDLEEMLNQAFQGLHDVADQHNDPTTSDFIEEHLLESQVDHIKKIGDHLANAKRTGPNLGEYMVEREFNS